MHILVITKFIRFKDLLGMYLFTQFTIHYSYFLVLIKRAVYIIRQWKFRKPSNKI